MLKYSVSYYEKVAGYWMQLRKCEQSFKTRKETEKFIDVLKSCPEIYDINLIDNLKNMWNPFKKNLNKEILKKIKKCEEVVKKFEREKIKLADVYKLISDYEDNRIITIKFMQTIIPIDKSWLKDTLAYSEGVCNEAIVNYKKAMRELEELKNTLK